MKRKPPIVVGAVALASALVLLGAGTAFAIPDDELPDTQTDILAEIEIVDVTFGDTVVGNIGVIPGTEPYPAGAPTGVARGPALITVEDVETPGLQSLAYCVNLVTSTNIGIRYSAADWSTGGVANSTYIAYILTNYYPYVAGVPAGSQAQQIAAVQSAIWYFSDGFVLTSDDAARPATAAIVTAALASGGITPPGPPSLALTPDTLSAPSDVPAAGPFTVTGTTTGATVQGTTGLDLYLDAARTVPAPVGTPVSEGTALWAGGVEQLVPPASFTIGAEYEVPVGTLYLADPDPDAFQKIVLAQTDILPVRASATVTLFEANAVTVVKSVGGTGAGGQSAIVLQVNCTPQPAAGTPTTFTVPPGAAAGDYSFTVTGVPVGATCSVVETANGASRTATLTSTSITPASVTIPASGEAAPVVSVVNRYETPALPVTGPEDRTATAIGGAAMLLAGIALVAVRRRMLHQAG